MWYPLLMVKAMSVLHVQCGKWIHSRCAGIKRVSQIFLFDILLVVSVMEELEKLTVE